MRKSTSKVKSRLGVAAISVGATAAAVLIAPGAAFAADITSASPSGGTTGVTVTLTGPASFFTGTSVGVVLTTATSCPANYTTTATTPAVAFAGGTPTRLSDTSATFVVPTTATVGKYNICAYNGSTAQSTLLHSASTNLVTYTVVPTSTTSPTAGNSGGGNTVTITVPATASLNTNNSVVFTPKANSCNGVYGSPAANTVATLTPATGSTTTGTVTVPNGVSGSLSAATPWSVCVFSSSTAVGAATALTAVGSAPYNVSLPAISLNPTIGAGGNLLITSATNFLTGVTAPQGLFVTGTCPAIYPAGPTANTFNPVLKTANNRAAVAVPSAVTVGNGPLYNVCVYSSTDTTTGRLIGNAAFTAATPPVVSTVTPAAGLALGGDTITVTGTGFPTTAGSITATLGGLPLTSVTPIDANTFTAVTPMHAPENGVPIVVTTATGTATKASIFNYVNSISISPNTAPNTADGVWVDVKGVGFESLTFDTAAFDATANATTPNTKARVWLVDKTGGVCTGGSAPFVCSAIGYEPGGASHTFVRGPSAECLSVAVISGTELFCKLNLKSGGLTASTGASAGTGSDAASVVPNGTYTLTVVNNGSPDAAAASVSQSVISSGSTFTVSDF